MMADRGVTAETGAALGLGWAPPPREGLKAALLGQGFSMPMLLRAGLLVQRDDGSVIDRFRNRLMIPICRDTGAVIAFGGRALEADQQPKYLNSPETPIYSKGRTLVRAEPVEGRHPPRRVRRAGRGVFRFRPGVPGRVCSQWSRRAARR